MREFLRGPLARVSYELDTAYYGTVAYNRRVMLEWTLDVVFAGLRSLGIMQYGPGTPSSADDGRSLAKPRPKLENTYHWINKLHHIGLAGGAIDYRPDAVETDAHGDIGESGANWEAAGWENFSAWRMDAVLGLAGLPPSCLRAFTLYMDGYDRTEIAKLMPVDGGEPWDDHSVRNRLQEASGQIRRRSELHWPAKGAPRVERTPATRRWVNGTDTLPPTSLHVDGFTAEIISIEIAIAKIRHQVAK